MRHIWSAFAQRGLRVQCCGGHTSEFDMARNEVHERVLAQVASGALRMILIIVPRDLCLRRSKGSRPAARRSWELRSCRFSRALSLCELMARGAHHAVLDDAFHDVQRMSGAVAGKLQDHHSLADVERRIVDLGCFGSGQPRRCFVASSLAGLRASGAWASADVASPLFAPPGLPKPPPSKLPDALFAELSSAVARELEHARR